MTKTAARRKAHYLKSGAPRSGQSPCVHVGWSCSMHSSVMAVLVVPCNSMPYLVVADGVSKVLTAVCNVSDSLCCCSYLDAAEEIALLRNVLTPTSQRQTQKALAMNCPWYMPNPAIDEPQDWLDCWLPQCLTQSELLVYTSSTD